MAGSPIFLARNPAGCLELLAGLPFERVAMDFIGPFPQTQRAAWYMLVLMDYATRNPEAVALPSLASSGVAWSMMRFFSHVKFPTHVTHRPRVSVYIHSDDKGLPAA